MAMLRHFVVVRGVTQCHATTLCSVTKTHTTPSSSHSSLCTRTTRMPVEGSVTQRAPTIMVCHANNVVHQCGAVDVCVVTGGRCVYPTTECLLMSMFVWALMLMCVDVDVTNCRERSIAIVLVTTSAQGSYDERRCYNAARPDTLVEHSVVRSHAGGMQGGEGDCNDAQ